MESTETTPPTSEADSSVSDDSITEQTCLLAKPPTSTTGTGTSTKGTVAAIRTTSTSTTSTTTRNPNLKFCPPGCGHTSKQLLQPLLQQPQQPPPPPTTTTSTTTATGTPTYNVDRTINLSGNTLLVYRLQDMRKSSDANLVLAILCLIYLGINITLVCVNYVNHVFENSHPVADYDNEPVDDTIFHLVEFWATSAFAIIECVALVYTPKSLYKINGGLDPLFLKVVLFFNIVATTVPAVMISLSIETFEIISHEIEYINELTMSFIDVILLLSLWKSKSPSTSSPPNSPSTSPNTNASTNNNDNDTEGTATTSNQAWITTGVALLVAVVQLGVYNLLGYDEEKEELVGECAGHFLEFSFEIISSLIAFWFCMDNKFVADKEIGMILYGNHQQDCQICVAQSTEFALDHQTKNNGTATTTNNKQQGQLLPPLYQQSSYYQTV